MRIPLLSALMVLAVVLGLSASAAAVPQLAVFSFLNNSTDTWTMQPMEVSSSMKDPIYGTLKIQSGGKSVSVAGTNGTALTFKIVWKKDSDGTTCTYFGSQKFNQYTNWQVYVTATAGGSNPNSINCTVISPGSYETTGFNMTYGVS